MTVSEAGRKGGKTTGERHKKRVAWGAGRPTNLTPELAERICDEIIETACSFYTAGLALGVPWTTLYYWERWGREGKQPYAEFTQMVMQARALSQTDHVREFKEADRDRQRSTQYYPFILERAFPHEYGNRINLIQQIADLPDADLEAEIQSVRSRVSPLPGGGEGPAALPAGEPADGDE